MQISKIEALPKEAPRKKRVAAYARVSDGKDAMLHSLAAQISYYSDLIQKNPEWEFVSVFADEALTGTKDTRPEFQRMMAECRAGHIDMVITKAISRLARNTVTILESVRALKELNIDVYFEEQNIRSLSGDGELMLTILSSYAQEESRSCSENCRWHIRKQFAEGRPTGGNMLGYKQVNGVFTILPEEAEPVRQIYDDYLSGMGFTAIEKKLRSQGVKFTKSAISKLLRNEKYQGDMLLQIFCSELIKCTPL
jgi:DNA invertase Pin-like site-specific DNA recombinase